MACTVADFRLRFPEFANDAEYTDARIQLFLDDAVDCHLGSDEARWCNKYNKAQCYIAAHLLYTGTNTEAGDVNSKAGSISSKTAGGVSVTRAVVSKDRSDSDNFFYATSYGQQFLLLRNSCFVGVLAANCL